MRISRIIYLTPEEYQVKLNQCEKLCEDCGHIQCNPGVDPLSPWPTKKACDVCGEKMLIGFDQALALKLVDLTDGGDGQ